MNNTDDLKNMTIQELRKEDSKLYFQILAVLQNLCDNGTITVEERDALIKDPSLISSKNVDEKNKKYIIEKNNRKQEVKKLIDAKKTTGGKKQKIVEKEKLGEENENNKSNTVVHKISPELRNLLIGAGLVILGATIIPSIIKANARNKNDSVREKIIIQTEASTAPTSEPTSEPTPTPTVTYDPDSNTVDVYSGDGGEDEEETIYTAYGTTNKTKREIKEAETSSSTPTNNTPAPTSYTPAPSSNNNNSGNVSYDSDEESYEEMKNYYDEQIEINKKILNIDPADNNTNSIGNYEKAVCKVYINGEYVDIGERIETARAAAMKNQYDRAFNEDTIDLIHVILKCGEYKNQTERVQLATAGILATGIGSKFTDNMFTNETNYFINELTSALAALKQMSAGTSPGYK